MEERGKWKLEKAGLSECRKPVEVTQEITETSQPVQNQNKRGDCAQLEQACDWQMERSEKSDACFVRFAVRFAGDTLDATLQEIQRLIIDGCSGRKIHYAAHVVESGKRVWLSSGAKEIRSIWCTTCAGAEKCANCILRGSMKKEESPSRSCGKLQRNIRSWN